jgi:hypothetical protein
LLSVINRERRSRGIKDARARVRARFALLFDNYSGIIARGYCLLSPRLLSNRGGYLADLSEPTRLRESLIGERGASMLIVNEPEGAWPIVPPESFERKL